MVSLPARYCAIDTETTGLYRHVGHRPFAAAGVVSDGTEYFWRWDPSTMREIEGSAPLDKLVRIMEDPHCDKVFHNRKFDEGMLSFTGIPLRGKGWDTGIFIHLLDGRDALGASNLDAATKKYLPGEMQKVVEPIEAWFKERGISKRHRNFQDLPGDVLQQRTVGDTRLTFKLFRKVFSTVQSVFPYLLDMEHRLIPAVRDMEDRGLLIDPGEIETQIAFLETIIEDVADFACGVLDWPVWNLNSPKDQRALLEEAGIYQQITEFTKPKKGRKSSKPFVPQRKMDTRNLMDLHHPVAHMMLVGKAAAKMISPFLTQARDLAVDGVLHPNFKQTGTTSGRFSCAEPNLQNIPVEGERKAQYTEDEAQEIWDSTGYNVGQHIKRVFLVRPGYCHIHLDKRQAEMFALGHYTKDKNLLHILQHEDSVHDGMCRLLFGEITKGLKQRSKQVTFGYQYGCGLETTAKKIQGTIHEARVLRNRLAHTFSGLPAWREHLDSLIRAQGYVQTAHGRRHYLYKNESYMAVNRMCQGHVGDELKSRMVAAYEYLQNEGSAWDARLLLNIHDEMVVECAIADLPEAGPALYNIMMQSDIEHEVPIPSEMELTFTRWSDTKKVENPLDPSTYNIPESRIA